MEKNILHIYADIELYTAVHFGDIWQICVESEEDLTKKNCKFVVFHLGKTKQKTIFKLIDIKKDNQCKGPIKPNFYPIILFLGERVSPPVK